MEHKKTSLEKLLEREHITEAELKAVIHSAKVRKHGQSSVSFGKKSFFYGYFSDPHIGHKGFDYALWDKMISVFRKEKPDFVLCPGDNVEGMSGRPGHVYELELIGFKAQTDRAVELYGQIPCKIYGIDGNHDGWFYKKNDAGAIVGEVLAQRVKQYEFLGQNEGDLVIDGIKIKMVHPNDGSAYAVSYKLQKMVESLGGGEKPSILHQAHYHKALYMFTRNVHGFESGTLCSQSEFMRLKKLPAHKGFGLVAVQHNGESIDRLTHTFFPAYD